MGTKIIQKKYPDRMIKLTNVSFGDFCKLKCLKKGFVNQKRIVSKERKREKEFTLFHSFSFF